MRQQVRQGDILLIPVGKQKAGKKEPQQEGKAILALGEAMGHHHYVKHPGAVIFAVEENLRILRLKEKATLEHEEHAPIELYPGDWQIVRQRENTALGWRTVLD